MDSSAFMLWKKNYFQDMPIKSKKSKKRGERVAKNKMSLDEFVGREAVYEDENGVLHKTPAAAGLEPFPG